MNRIYFDTARLLTHVAPLLFTDGLFALKGGTAINLFMRDMPRLSVDLDLVFVDHRVPREQALTLIHGSLQRIAARLTERGFQTHTMAAAEGGETKLLVRRGGSEVKVEVNTVMRGTVHPVNRLALTEKASASLMAELEIPVVSREDAYGGKRVAALDRQHPRDLFDVMQLLAHEGITPAIRRAFVVYLACHNRPLHEVLSPQPKDLRREYERTFRGMTAEPVELDRLLAVRESLVQGLPRSLDDTERRFLCSLARNAPRWDLLGVEHAGELPGIRWKLQNLARLEATNPAKFHGQAQALERLLGGEGSGVSRLTARQP